MSKRLSNVNTKYCTPQFPQLVNNYKLHHKSVGYFTELRLQKCRTMRTLTSNMLQLLFFNT